MEIAAFHPFRSEETRHAYLAHYDCTAEKWPAASQTSRVDTSLGETFVRISGPAGAQPLVLLPGSVLHSLMWIPNIEALSRRYRTYAVDHIYDSGRSVYTKPPKSPDDLTGWLDELFTALGHENGIHLMGLSYGAWLASLYAIRHPERVGKIVLLAHPAIVPMRRAFVLRFLLGFASEGGYKRFTSWLFEDALRQDESRRWLVRDLLEDMYLAGKCYKPKSMVLPKTLTDRELQEIRVPALFLAGENEKTFSPQKAVQRLNRAAPAVRTEIIPGAGHDLSFVQAGVVNQKVLEFLGQEPWTSSLDQES